MSIIWERRLAARLQTNKLYEVEVPLDRKAIADAIRNALRTLGYPVDRYSNRLDFLDEDWWSWERDVKIIDPDKKEPARDYMSVSTNNAVYSGRIVKRLRKALLIRAELNLGSDTAAELAQLVENWLGQQGKFAFDFTREIDWDRGDFGEAGACFWGDHELAKDMLMSDPKFLAMRFYAAQDANERYYGSGKGVGRAWIVQRELNGVTCPILFNGYWAAGANHSINHDYGGGSNCTKMAGNVLRAHLKGRASIIDLYNNDTASGMLWVNNACGVLIHPQRSAAIKEISCVDMHIHDLTPLVCTYCSRQAEEELCMNGDYYCRRCWDKYTAYCAHCDERYCTDYGFYHEHSFYCHECFNEAFWRCTECGEVIDRTDEEPCVHMTCRACVELLRTRCFHCHRSLIGKSKESICRVRGTQTKADLFNANVPEDMVRWLYCCKGCVKETEPPMMHCPACDTFRLATRVFIDRFDTEKCSYCGSHITSRQKDCSFCGRSVLRDNQTEVICDQCKNKEVQG